MTSVKLTETFGTVRAVSRFPDKLHTRRFSCRFSKIGRVFCSRVNDSNSGPKKIYSENNSKNKVVWFYDAFSSYAEKRSCRLKPLKDSRKVSGRSRIKIKFLTFLNILFIACALRWHVFSSEVGGWKINEIPHIRT